MVNMKIKVNRHNGEIYAVVIPSTANHVEEIKKMGKVIRAACYAVAETEDEKRNVLTSPIEVIPRSDGGYWIEFE